MVAGVGIVRFAIVFHKIREEGIRTSRVGSNIARMSSSEPIGNPSVFRNSGSFSVSASAQGSTCGVRRRYRTFCLGTRRPALQQLLLDRFVRKPQLTRLLNEQDSRTAT